MQDLLNMIIKNNDGTWSFDENAAVKAVLDHAVSTMIGFNLSETPECVDDYTKMFKAYVDLVASIKAFTNAVDGNCHSV